MNGKPTSIIHNLLIICVFSELKISLKESFIFSFYFSISHCYTICDCNEIV